MGQIIREYPLLNFRDSWRWSWSGASSEANLSPLTRILTPISGLPASETGLYWHWPPSRCPYLFVAFCAYFGNEIWQAARDVSASHDVLLDLFQRMDDFFKRFKIYSRTFLNTELAEVLVKVMVKVLHILSIATKEVEKGRASESLLLSRWICF